MYVDYYINFIESPALLPSLSSIVSQVIIWHILWTKGAAGDNHQLMICIHQVQDVIHEIDLNRPVYESVTRWVLPWWQV